MGVILLLGGLPVAGIGLLMYFAGMMSDAPELGDRYGKQGCIVAVVGALAVIVGALLLLHVIG